jgi:hypothetical protein
MAERDSFGKFIPKGTGVRASSSTPFIGMSLSGIDKIQGNIKRLQLRAPELASQVMRTSAMAVIVPAVKAQIKKNRSVFTGELHARMNARSGVERHEPFVDIGAFGVPYGLAVEKGAGPHVANTNRVREYVRKKMGFEGPMASAVVAQILSTLETEGSKPHPYILPVWNALSGRFFSDFVTRMKVQLAKGK